MAEISVPIPTVAEAGQGAAWLTSQAGIVATVLAVICIVLTVFLVLLFRSCKAEMFQAWAQVTKVSEARQSDVLTMVKALADNTLALTRVGDKVDISDRRSNR